MTTKIDTSNKRRRKKLRMGQEDKMTKEKAKTYLIVIMIAVTAYVMRDAWLPGVIDAVGQGQQPAQTWAVATPTLAQFAPTAEPMAVATAVPIFGGVAESAPVIVAATAVPDVLSRPSWTLRAHSPPLAMLHLAF